MPEVDQFIYIGLELIREISDKNLVLISKSL